jgi:squalene synthase HpnC
MSNSHYENFPVASPLLPARLRAPIRVIYAFARTADDIADEGDLQPDERIAALDAYERELDHIANNQLPQTLLFQELQTVIKNHQLTLQPLRDLLSAFRQDVIKTRYANFEELLDYCTRSANPVGRIMLALFGETSATALKQSDQICSALQLINFLQDVAIDWGKSRVYLPQKDLNNFHVSEAQIADALLDANWRAMMQFEVERARQMLISGAPLARQLPGRMGWELRLIVQGGLRICEKIAAVNYDVFHHRPKLVTKDWIIMFWRAVVVVS